MPFTYRGCRYRVAGRNGHSVARTLFSTISLGMVAGLEPDSFKKEQHSIDLQGRVRVF
jgi:hypothetical protein